MTKRPKRAEKLPRLRRAKVRRVFCHLILGLDNQFYMAFNGVGFDALYALEVRHIYLHVLCNHLDGKTSTAVEVAAHSRVSRETVRRILDDLVRIRWLTRSGSHYWISKRMAAKPQLPPNGYRMSTKLVLTAAKELQSKGNK